jgi:hypothetical protein
MGARFIYGTTVAVEWRDLPTKFYQNTVDIETFILLIGQYRIQNGLQEHGTTVAGGNG